MVVSVACPSGEAVVSRSSVDSWLAIHRDASVGVHL